jgi:hypothetical protein
MKCPLFKIARRAAAAGNITFDSSCVGKDCAWWHEEHGQCSILTIAMKTTIKVSGMVSTHSA